MQITIKEFSLPEKIEFNYEELKAGLANRLEKYRNLAYSEDNIKEAKNDRANLNRLKAAIDAERKNMKAICLKPYEEFEAKVKELTGMIDAPVLAIDSQIKKFDNAKREAKRAEYEAFYNKVAGDLANIVPFGQIFEERWTNSSVSAKAVQDVIKNKVEKINQDLQTIDAFGGDMTIACKSIYLKTLNLNDALAEKTRIDDLNRKLQEASLKEAEKELQAQPVEQVEQPVAEPVPAPVASPLPVENEEPVQPELYELTFKVVVTREQLTMLRSFLKNNNIKYERA